MDNFLPPDEKSIFYRDSKKYHRPVSVPQPKPLNEGVQQKIIPRAQNFSQQSTPQAFLPSAGILEPTPNAASSLVVAICSLPFSICRIWWFGFGWIWGLGTITGIILSCIALHLAREGIQMTTTSPDVFSQKDIEKLRMAKVIGIVSLAICGLSFVLLIYYYSVCN